MKNIGLFTSVYFNNIGNAFIDFGAQATIEGITRWLSVSKS